MPGGPVKGSHMFNWRRSAAALAVVLIFSSIPAVSEGGVFAARKKHVKTSVRIVSAPRYMQSGLAYRLKARIKKGKKQQIYWKSDSSYARIGRSTGRLVCTGAGTVRITAYTADGASSSVVRVIKTYPVFGSVSKAADYVRYQMIGRNKKVRFETTKELPEGFMERYVCVPSDGDDYSDLGSIVEWHRFEEALNGRNYYHCYKFRYR